MKSLGTLLITVTLIVGLVGCGGVARYDLAISSTAGGSTTTPGEAGPYTYYEGTDVDLVAEAEEGYRFVNWTGDVDTIDDVNAASTTITMNADYVITANFVAQYVLTIESTEGGEVTTPGEGTFAYNEGTVVDLVAEAEEGYRFVNWTGDVDDITNADAASTTVIMNDNYSIAATFRASVLTVGGSGRYDTIQEAINSAGSGDTIQVAQGTYLENIAITTSKSFTLQGGWDSGFTSRSNNCSLTVIEGKGSGSAIEIQAGPDVAIELTIEGFTIRNGIAEWGAGIRIASYGGSNITLLLNNNFITENTATNRGGGISIESAGGSINASVTNSIIAENTANNEGAGIRVYSGGGGVATLTLTKNVITDNTVTHLVEGEGGWDGGGIAVYASPSGSTTLQAINNLFTANEAGFGGGLFGYASGAEAVVTMILTSNIITSNRAQYGAGIFSCSGKTCPVGWLGGLIEWVLTNNTVTGNTASHDVGGIYMYSGSTFGDGGNMTLLMRNDIVYGNTDRQVMLTVEPGRLGVATANMAYSDIGAIGTRGGGTYTTDHVINKDPLFVDPANGLFLLEEGSPCIDSGDPNTVFNDGQRPPAKGTERNDMGAYGGPQNYDWFGLPLLTLVSNLD